MPSWLVALLVPPLVFQSIMVAGGYGTGQEFLVFFLNHGPLAGLLGLLVVTIPLLSLCAAVAFEFARLHSAYDYREFFRALLGPGWLVWEAGFLLTLVILFGVIGSAAGEIVRASLAMPYWSGTGILMGLVALLVWQPNRYIERILAGWAIVLYVAFILFFAMGFARFGGALAQFTHWGDLDTPWASSAARYAALQLSILPAMLFCLPRLKDRRQALLAGILTGPIAMAPGLLFYLIMLTHYPSVTAQVLPSAFLLAAIDSRPLTLFFQIALFGTLVQTGAGVIHAFNQRVEGWMRSRGRPMPRMARPLIAIALMATAMMLARIGLVGLMNIVFGTLAWVFVVIFIVPLLTFGLLRVWQGVAIPVASR